MYRLNTQNADFDAAFIKLLGAKRETDVDVNDTVKTIIQDVQNRGDDALIEYTTRLDLFPLTVETLAITPDEIDQAVKACDKETLDALNLAAGRIMEFHSHQRPDDLDYTDSSGIRLGYRWTAVDAAGLYVPGGTASYPSSVLMNAIPAKVAGVERLVMVVPTPGGKLNPLVLAAAQIASVDEIYRVGGAQAIAALAHGTDTIRPVDKIVGPGNAYVAAAKRQVFGTVGIDMIAGPSEILILADSNSNPSWVAADLLSQAEHDKAAQSILITPDAVFAASVETAIESHLSTLSRSDIARASWQDFGAIICVQNLMEAIPLINQLAPEHLELAIDNARAFSLNIKNAGAIFLGHFVPEALGDYLAGPNHVLPTARSARFSSGLGVLDFMKRSSMIECTSDGLNAVSGAAATLARAEGLDAHALSLDIRTNRKSG